MEQMEADAKHTILIQRILSQVWFEVTVWIKHVDCSVTWAFKSGLQPAPPKIPLRNNKSTSICTNSALPHGGNVGNVTLKPCDVDCHVCETEYKTRPSCQKGAELSFTHH